MSTTTTIITSPVAERKVGATITYSLLPQDGSQAYQNTIADPKTGQVETNIIREAHDGVLIENVRGKESLYTLDNAGFQYHNHPTKLTNFGDDKNIEEIYYPESIELIKELTGASRVVPFDHTHRLRRPGETESSAARRQPVAVAHVDQTTAASISRVHRHLPDEASILLQHRFQIINLWRPIGNPAFDWPLTLCDYRSVNAENDTFPVKIIFPTREGETMAVKHSSRHEWKYLRGMTPDEFVLIKCFDSVQDGSVAVFTPHTGFQDPTTPKDTPLRESIELRALVFYD